MEYQCITRADDSGVTTVTIAREAVRNALSRQTIAELADALAAFASDPALRVAVLTGAGQRAFAAGADIGELAALGSALEARQICEATHTLGEQIAAMPKIVIAAINGVALGGGLELAMCCDLRIAAETARFGQPEINLGIIPGWGGTQRLPRLVGAARALLLCVTGEPIGADEALRIGLVERVVPAEALLPSAQALAAQIARQAPLAVAAIKQAIGRGGEMTLRDGCAYEAALFGTIAVTDDAREGTRAFLEKRPAAFAGR